MQLLFFVIYGNNPPHFVIMYLVAVKIGSMEQGIQRLMNYKYHIPGFSS